MPAIDPKSLSTKLQNRAPSRNLTPQEMQMAIAQMKSPSAPTAPRSTRRFDSGLNPDDSPIMPPRVEEMLPANFVEEAPPQLPMQSNSGMVNPRRRLPMTPYGEPSFAKGGVVKSKGIDGCAQRGKTKGKYI
jgi:hypothetical protein